MGARADVRASARVWFPPNLEMGDGAVIGPGVDCYNQALISIGTDALVSQRAYLCAGTHDVDDPNFQLVVRPIRIGSGAWIAAEAFIGPGAIIGDRAVIGARAVAFGRFETNMIYCGNPAQPVRPRRLAPGIREGNPADENQD
jgi:putative colanic acid biosynthesis acetyltransferase WcaF